MTKCKNCGIEEQGYATLLDKRGYCYKPHCQSCSYDEVEQQNTRLQAELDKAIKDNRKLVRALKDYADVNFWYNRDDESGWEVAQEVLKEVGEEE